MYLIFDTETSDLPRRWDAPASDINNWPRLVQLAWVVCDDSGRTLEQETHLIKPIGFEIAQGAIDRHGITNEFAEQYGGELLPVLDRFHRAVKAAKMVVGHNVSFDVKVMGSEFIRAGMKDPFSRKRKRCTMKAAIGRRPQVLIIRARPTTPKSIASGLIVYDQHFLNRIMSMI